jgi:hypothetical protein
MFGFYKSLRRVAPALAAILISGASFAVPEEKPLTYVGSTLWTKAHDVEIRDPLVYCAFLNGFRILDFSDPRKPVLLSQIYLGGGFAVDVAGALAVVAAADKGLALIDVSDPKAPVLKSVLDTPGEARDVAIGGQFAYVADGPGGLLIVDIKDPAAPKIVGSWDSPGESRGLVLRDRLVYLADGSAGLQILDIGTPARPAIIGTLDTDGEAESVVVSGNSVYIADGSGGIKVIDIGTPAGPKLAASLTASGYAQSVSVEGTVLGVGSLYDGGYQLLDISNPRAPAVLFTGKYTMYNESWRVVLKGSQAWIPGILLYPEFDRRRLRPGPLGLRGRRVVRTSGRGRGRSRPSGECRGDEYLPRRAEYDSRRKHHPRDRPLVGEIFRHFGSGPPPRGKTPAHARRRSADDHAARRFRLFDGR